MRDLAVAGGKGANLGELVRAGFAVPDGFVITTAAYARAGARHPAPFGSADAAATRDAVSRVAIPDECGTASSPSTSGSGRGAVAVRSSATAEDLPGAAFAGQQETFLNVQGRRGAAGRGAALLGVALVGSGGRVPGAARDRDDDVQIAVVVQVLVPADIAGVMFTAEPVTGERDRRRDRREPRARRGGRVGARHPDHAVLDARDRVVEHRAGAPRS